jgi:hypothetical protein
MSQQYTDAKVEAAAASVRTYVPINNFPDAQPAVLLLFRGLFLFAFNGTTGCEIGIHNATHDTPSHEAPHSLRLRVWKKSDPNCPLSHTAIGIDDPRTTPLSLTVQNPAELPGVVAYERGRFDRQDPSSSPYHNAPFDFRWTLDLEGPDFYDRVLKKNPAKMRPGLTINHGLFFTFYKTRSKFKRAQGPNERVLGSVAEIVGINLYLNMGGKVILNYGGQSIELPKIDNVTHQVDFFNDCRPFGCTFDVGSSDKKKRNDFYLNFDAVNLEGDSEHELKIREQFPGDLDIFPCRTSRFDTTDPAPCAPVVFGKSTSLD